MNKIITIIIIFLAIPTLTQAQNLPQTLEQQINSARQGESAVSMNWRDYSEEEKSAVLPSLEDYAQDSSEVIRLKSYDLLYQIGLSSEALAQASLQAFLQGLNDEDRGVQGFVAERLRAFEAEEYNEDMRDVLLQKLNPRPFYYEQLVLALAYINENRAISPIINHLRTQSSEMSQLERWQAHIALARMGEQPALDFIVRKSKELPVSDDIIYEIYPTLAFTRQKAAVDVMVEQVFSDAQNCSSPDPDSNRKITCAYRILEIIAPIIVDFPIPVDEATGDLATEDYEQALEQARDWLKDSDYEVVAP